MGKQTAEEKRIIREYYRRVGICPVCKTNHLIGDEKTCIECRAEGANQKYIYVQENRDKVNANQRRTRKIRYEKDIANGICPRCRKRKLEVGRKRCGMCRAKDLERRRARVYHELPRAERYLHGLCFFCDEKVKEGFKVCEHHYKLNVENAKKANIEYEYGWKFIYGKNLKEKSKR